MPTTMNTVKHPKPPEQIDDEALLEWQRLCDQLDADGLLQHADLSLMAIYCRTHAVWFESDRNVREFGNVVKFPNGFPGTNPHYKVIERLAPQLAKLREQLWTAADARRSKAPTKKALSF